MSCLTSSSPAPDACGHKKMISYTPGNNMGLFMGPHVLSVFLTLAVCGHARGGVRHV